MLAAVMRGPYVTRTFLVTINSAQPDFELNFVTMEIIFHKCFNFSGKITALSGFLFIGTHCI